MIKVLEIYVSYVVLDVMLVIHHSELPKNVLQENILLWTSSGINMKLTNRLFVLKMSAEKPIQI